MNNIKNILVIHTSSALNSFEGKEALDISLIFGAYEQNVSVLFYQQGVFQTLAKQNPESLGHKDYLSSIKSLDIYDVEQVYACQQSLKQYGFDESKLINNVERASMDTIDQLKSNADHIFII